MKSVRFMVALGLSGVFTLHPGFTINSQFKVVPGEDAFFEKTNVLFTDQEHKIYSRIKDQARRKIFVEDFWKVRDFNPATEANEAEEAFEQRMDMASRMFSPRMAGKKVLLSEVTKADWGWNTGAGRVIVLLGPPDSVGTIESFGASDAAPAYGIGSSSIDRFDAGSMKLSYLGFGIQVGVSRTPSGDWQGYPPRAVSDFCRLHYGWTSYKGGEKPYIQFTSEYDDGAVRMRFPVSRVAFSGESSIRKAQIKVLINVYRDLVKVESIEREIAREETAAAINNIRDLRAEIAYRPESPGKYLLDIVAWDLLSETPYPFRQYVEFKVR